MSRQVLYNVGHTYMYTCAHLHVYFLTFSFDWAGTLDHVHVPKEPLHQVFVEGNRGSKSVISQFVTTVLVHNGTERIAGPHSIGLATRIA